LRLSNDQETIMTKVLILGAHGQIARVATDLFLKETDAQLTLYLRNARRLRNISHEDRVRAVEGDVLDLETLEAATAGQDVVYANLAGQMEQQARCIVKAMKTTDVKRLIEASDLDYTILRPAWLNDRDEIAYDITRKGETFANPQAYVSRKSVADLVVKLATTRGWKAARALACIRPCEHWDPIRKGAIGTK
jgi:uncharacterized protein YbjT (DUF2867 family)